MAEIAKRNTKEVEVWHLLSALMNQENGIVPALMDEMGVGLLRQRAAADRKSSQNFQYLTSRSICP